MAAVTTWSRGSLVTDSAAAATALACGRKTANGIVSMSPEGESLPTAMELAARRGMRTGVVTTTAVTDATPAAFTAHVPSRRLMTQVAGQQIAQRNLDVILGGGLQFFVGKGKPCSSAGALGRGIFDGPSARKDDRDLIVEAKKAGFQVVTSREALEKREPSTRLLGLFSSYVLPYRLDRDADDEADAPSLADMTRAALEVLGDSENGFFLVVEAARVDHACHDNDAGAALGELRELDDTMELLLTELEQRDDLLVIFTADHETGGLSLASSKHGGDPLTFAVGGLAKQRGSLESVSYARRRAGKDGDPPLEDARKAVATLTEDDAARPSDSDGRHPFLGRSKEAWSDPASRAGSVVFATDGHTATPVPLLAKGPGAERFGGLMGNDYVGRILMQLAKGD
jgi:alkaline phosphatase